jgi:hypothetical protein
MKKKKEVQEFESVSEAIEKLFPKAVVDQLEAKPDPSEFGKELADRLIEGLKKELAK